MPSTQLEKQWALFEAGDYERAAAETRELLVRLPGADKREAHRLLGRAYYELHDHREALDWLREAAAGSDLADDWCRLALAATMMDNDRVAAEAFEQARFCHQASRYLQSPGLFVHVYWYAAALSDREEYAPARLLLDELAQAYRRLHRTDTVFLYARGMPFLSSVLSLALQCFSAQKEHAAGVAWLEALAKGLDEAGQRQVGQAMRDLLRQDGMRTSSPGPFS